MSYILRAVIHEDRWETQLKDIIWLCKKVGIDEVLLKEQCHQILMSPFPLEKHKRMAQIYKLMITELKKEKIKCGVNIATIVGHVDCKLNKDKILPYEKFTGFSLKPCDSVYCILDPKWQQYAAQVVALYAKAGAQTIMIDDDFRSLNHSESIGCFCNIHVQKVCERAGKKISARQLQQAVISNSANGKKIRKIWMDSNFEGQLQAARKIERAIHAVDKNITVGLMNSGESAHELQGRDMTRLLQTFSGSKDFILSRPLGGSYEDCLHENLIDMHQGMALSISRLPEGAHIISEVENWPHTLYNKSLKITDIQMKLHILAGAQKNSLNVFDFLASPYKQEMPMVRLLQTAKKDLQNIQKLRSGKNPNGVGLLWESGQEEKKVLDKKTADNLLIERNADRLFPLLGIPTCFKESDVNFLSAENALCCDETTLLRLLKKGLLLDAKAARFLCGRGYGNLIGCSYTGKNIDEVSAELLVNKKFNASFTDNLLPTDWMRLSYLGIAIPLFEYAKECQIISVYVNDEKKYLGDGIALFENMLGGRICIIPSHIGKWQFAHKSRACQMSRIVQWLSRNSFPVLVQNGVNIAPFYYECGTNGNGILALLNTGLDTESFELTGSIKIEGFSDKNNKGILAPLELKILKTRRAEPGKQSCTNKKERNK